MTKSKNLEHLMNPELADAETGEDKSVTISTLMSFCSNVLKNNLTDDEFHTVLDEISGIPGATKGEIFEGYQEILKRLHCIDNAYEEPEEALNYPNYKKFPLKMGLNEDLLSSLNGKLADVSWRVFYTLNTKSLNKVYKPMFVVTLKVVTDGFGLGGAWKEANDDSYAEKQDIKILEFQCTQEELTYLLNEVKAA
mmetsp:Transcript_25074/g.24824  ORF Transcript_25074/g.24824 Transcript_25074/m.24824 type:complete len:195 (+) Transcript_25074:136-720(+)|eukprot:CAMPEP_0197008744 /NCGR_PEP_ID=MMETSP1380-20130617/46719_1 /TAXON_ID=5936 /ORGANISM="Euplotes crassus, Strain CT5" /LENGTH=194 /DNA_ID=CAMNT_0042429525 /DNA_START=136 /DNA_END=720 /DNA_ORIENTATION=+